MMVKKKAVVIPLKDLKEIINELEDIKKKTSHTQIKTILKIKKGEEKKVSKENFPKNSNKDFQSEKIKLEAQIFELKQIISILNNRLINLEKALSKLQLKTVELCFNPSISIEDRKIKWLQNQILEPHRKHGLKWKYRFIPGTSNIEKLILWIPQNFETRHLDEIKRCVEWVNKKQREASK